MALELAEDRRRGVRREAEAAVGVEPVDGLHQAEHGDLGEVLTRLATVGEAVGETVGQPAVGLHEMFGEGGVARPQVLAVQSAHIVGTPGPRSGAT